jgi:lipopolysaccharide transport system ATP-binding protein
MRGSGERRMDLLMSSERVASSMMADDVAISVRGLGKCYQLYEKPVHRMLQSLIGKRGHFYREFWALRNVDFDVRKGEAVGIIGRNGAGKSTLLQMIAGTLRPSEGHASAQGRVAALLELGSGFNPDFTGRQNVYLNASILGLTRREIDARIEDILAYADIDEFVDQPIRNYSTGMVMRLAFAVVAHVDADILIVDEALAVGDAFFMQKCMRFLREFRKRGTMLFVSHDGGAVTSLCDRAIWLERGLVERAGDARTVMDAYLEATLIERQGGVRNRERVAAPGKIGRARQMNARQDLMDRTVLRNDMALFNFSPEVASFGESKANVTNVLFSDESGQAMAMVAAGELVTLEIELQADQDVHNVIVGFYIKNKHGQLLFGDNTVMVHQGEFTVAGGEAFRACFRFEMPRLGAGDYFVTVGVAEGTQEQHVIQQWIHEAVRFTATGGSYASGLIGLPMHGIVLERISHGE